MFEIKRGENDEIVAVGRLDASHSSTVETFFSSVTSSAVVDLSQLEYISSMGIRVLVSTQRRLAQSGAALRLKNASEHVREVLRISGLQTIFEME